MKTKRNLLQLCLLAAGLLGMAWLALPAAGQSIVVTNAADSGAGTLRQAITTATNGAVITFDPSLSGATILLASTLTINTNLTIDASALPGGIQINGNDNTVFWVTARNTVVMNSLTITNGFQYEGIGGVYNGGTLTLNHCTVAGNSSVGGYGAGGIVNDLGGTLTLNQSTLSNNSSPDFIDAGGIENYGSLTVSQSIVSGNVGSMIISGGTLVVNQSTLSGNSGGIVNGGVATVNKSTISENTSGSQGGGVDNSGTMTLNECTLSGNNAPYGGGIFNSGILTVNQSTVAGNSATGNYQGTGDVGYGGGIENVGMLTLSQSTLSGNTASGGGGIDNGGGGNLNSSSGGTLMITNSIIAGNTASVGSDIYNEPAANYNNYAYNSLTYGGSNIVQNTYDPDSGISGSTPINGAPLLAALGNYGGPTQTMPPLPGSPAIGAGVMAGNTFSTDQRGYSRTQNGLIDIGAVELPTIASFTASPTNALLDASVQFNATNADSDGSAITQWNWSFGDGGTSTAQNPAHTYAGTGSYTPTLTVTNNLGIAVAATGPKITVTTNLVENDGFETGDFTGWTLSGDLGGGDTFVDNLAFYSPHSGSYYAALGTSSTYGYLSQTLATVPGASYLLSFWWNNQDGNANSFSVSWNGSTVFGPTNLPGADWTFNQFSVKATTASTPLQFQFENNGDVLGLDDVGVVYMPSPAIRGTSLSKTNLVINITNGLAGIKYVVLVSTNLTLPRSQWTPVATNVLGANGNFTLTVTNAVNRAVPRQFYLLQVP